MTKEKYLTKKIQLICEQNNIVCFDVNVGKFELKTGGYFDVGLPKGFPDLLLLTPDGRVIFIEAKTETGRLASHQKDFLNFLRAKNLPAFVIYGIDDFLFLLKNDFKLDTSDIK